MVYNEEYAKQGLDPMCREPRRYGRMFNMEEKESNTKVPGEKNSHLKECVFGPEIKSPCPIRAILESTQKEKEKEDGKEVLEKALGTGMPPQIQVLFEPFQNLLESISGDKQIGNLPNFCRCCPFLAKYTLDLMP